MTKEITIFSKIYDLDLEVRSYNILKKMGCKTVFDVIVNFNDIPKQKRCGSGTMSDIKKALGERLTTKDGNELIKHDISLVALRAFIMIQDSNDKLNALKEQNDALLGVIKNLILTK